MPFDHGFVFAACDRNNIKRNLSPLLHFDTATLAGLAYGQTVLAKACRRPELNFDKPEAHSALYDAQKTAELLHDCQLKWQAMGGWRKKKGPKGLFV